MTWNHDITAAPRGEEKKTVVQILKDARALIADEKNWTQRVFARNSRGLEVSALSSEASCFCTVGALGRFTNGMAIGSSAYLLLKREVGQNYIAVSDFNDTHTHAEVIALFDHAIARAESEPVQ